MFHDLCGDTSRLAVNFATLKACITLANFNIFFISCAGDILIVVDLMTCGSGGDIVNVCCHRGDEGNYYQGAGNDSNSFSFALRVFILGRYPRRHHIYEGKGKIESNPVSRSMSSNLPLRLVTVTKSGHICCVTASITDL